MTQIFKKHNRHSIRLKGYDYSQEGAYFVTICISNRECILGNIVDNEMRLNENGIIVRNEWTRTAQLRRNVTIGEFIVMPNHIHGIIIINDVGAHCNVPLRNVPLRNVPLPHQIESFGKSTTNSIPTIVKLFKSTTTKQINERRTMYGYKVWQRNYYEHIVRNEKELDRIEEYIINNPLRWQFDCENPDRINNKEPSDKLGEKLYART